MDTPASPEPGDECTLYGEHEKSINRRALLGGAMLLATAAAFPRDRRRIAAIGWSGLAKVYEGDRVLDLTVRTRVEPFRRARSTSWITSKGEASARTLVIEPDHGWLERDGERKPLPAALIAHERQQYGVYAYLLGFAPSHRTGRVVHAAQPGFPPIRMELTPDGWIAAADYTVADAETGRPLPQHFTFEGEIIGSGVRWFRRLTVLHLGRRYFELNPDGFFVERG